MRKILIVAFVLLISTGAFAQKFEYGIKAGLNVSDMAKVAGSEMRAGLHAGAFAEYTVSDYVGVQGELLYSMTGAKVKSILGNDVLIDHKIDYIVLPILAKLYVLEKLSVDIGPQFGYMVLAKDGKTKANYYKAVEKKFEFAAGMGLSYRLPHGIEVSARYNLGLAGPDINNNVIQAGVGYRF